MHGDVYVGLHFPQLCYCLQRVDGIVWNNATERAEIARKMFKDLLEFDEVEIFTELNK